MDIKYLDALPEVTNKYQVDLEDGEKVVFTAKLNTFGTEKDRMLGADDSTFTLTNKRIIAHNSVAFWAVDIPEIVSCTKVEYGRFIFKGVYFAVDLNTKIVFDDGKQELTGFHFYFNKANTAKFEEIVNSLSK